MRGAAGRQTPWRAGADPHPGLPPKRGKEQEFVGFARSSVIGLTFAAKFLFPAGRGQVKGAAGRQTLWRAGADPHPGLPPKRGKEQEFVGFARSSVIGLTFAEKFPAGRGQVRGAAGRRTPWRAGADPHPGLPPKRGKEQEFVGFARSSVIGLTFAEKSPAGRGQVRGAAGRRTLWRACADPHPGLPPKRGKEQEFVGFARSPVIGLAFAEKFPAGSGQVRGAAGRQTPWRAGADPHPGLPPKRGKEQEFVGFARSSVIGLTFAAKFLFPAGRGQVRGAAGRQTPWRIRMRLGTLLKKPLPFPEEVLG